MAAIKPSSVESPATPARLSRLHRTRRAGFSLVELLIVLAIMGVLLALLLPAVQAAREASRRTQCANNLKQLALAALNYEAANGLLPPSGLAATAPDPKYPNLRVEVFDQGGGVKLSWVVLLLSYLDEPALFDQFDLTRDVTVQPRQPQAASVPSLLCPSDEANGRIYSVPKAGFQCAKGNYATYVSPFHVDLQLLYRGALIAGGQRLASIEDGTTATLIFSEVRTMDLATDERGAWALPWTGASLLAFDMHPLGWSRSHDGTGEGDEYIAAKLASPTWRAPRASAKRSLPTIRGPMSIPCEAVQRTLS